MNLSMLPGVDQELSPITFHGFPQFILEYIIIYQTISLYSVSPGDFYFAPVNFFCSLPYFFKFFL